MIKSKPLDPTQHDLEICKSVDEFPWEPILHDWEHVEVKRIKYRDGLEVMDILYTDTEINVVLSVNVNDYPTLHDAKVSLHVKAPGTLLVSDLCCFPIIKHIMQPLLELVGQLPKLEKVK